MINSGDRQPVTADFGSALLCCYVRLCYLCEIEHQLVLKNRSMLIEIHTQEESRDDPHRPDMLIFWSELHFEFRLVEPSILNKILRADSYEIHAKTLNIH